MTVLRSAGIGYIRFFTLLYLFELVLVDNAGGPGNFGEADDVGLARLLNEFSANKSLGKLKFVKKTRNL